MGGVRMPLIQDINNLKRLRDVLGVAKARTLIRDGCGDAMLVGRRGHIYADGGGFLLVVMPGSTRGWHLAKERLGFARLTQDGDDEGCFRLDWVHCRHDRPDETEGVARGLPAWEAEAVQRVLGLPRRRPPPVNPFTAEHRPRGV